MPGTQPLENKNLKNAAKATIALLLVLLAGAVIFYKERMLFIDAPHMLFRIINEGHLQIEEYRYGSFISQILPLCGVWLHLPFRLLVILYSAGFYLFYLSVALLLVYKFRNYSLAILMGLYFTLFVSDTYYWPNNEVHQGIGWLFLAFALCFHVAFRKRPFVVTLAVFTASFYLAIWTHPLVMLVAVYLWFFYWSDKAQWPFSMLQSFILTTILLLLSYCKFHQGMHHGYDSCKIEIVTGFSLHKIGTIIASPQLRFFVKSCITNYWLFVVVFVAGLIGLLKEKKYLLFTWTVLFVTGYVLLVFIVFPGVQTNRFYIESEYMPLSVIASAPFVYYVLPKLSGKITLLVLVSIFSIRLVYIYNSAQYFTARVAIMEKMKEKMKEKNLTHIIIPDPGGATDSALIMNWAAPVESIMLSKLDNEDPQRTFIFADPGQVSYYLNTGKDTFLGNWEKRPVQLINSYYFQLDTGSAYQLVSFDYLMQ